MSQPNPTAVSLNRFRVLYTFFFLITALHIIANVRAVKAVHLRRFNESRYLIALEEYFRSGRILSVAECNGLERVTIGRTVSVSLKIRIGLSVQNLTEQHRMAGEIENLIAMFGNEKFFIAESQKFLGIYLAMDARPVDVIKAYFYAVSYLQDRNQFQERLWEVHNKWNDFAQLAHKEGWMTTSHLFFVDEYRINWRV